MITHEIIHDPNFITGGGNDWYINYGEKGLLGGWWKELYLEWDFEKPVTITAFETDYKNNPHADGGIQEYTVKIGDNLDQVVETTSGSHVLDKGFVAQNFCK